MFARVAVFEGGDEERLAALSEERGDADRPEGILRTMVFGGNTDGKRIFINLFESREAIAAAEVKFEELARVLPEEVRGRRVSVDVYELLWDSG